MWRYDIMNFGERLYKIRKTYNYRQEDVANILGVGKNTISNYEKNVSKPCYDVLVKLCNTFNVDADYFMQDDLTHITNNIQTNHRELIDAYNDKKLLDSDRRIVDFILGIGEWDSGAKTNHSQYSKETLAEIDSGNVILINTYAMPVSAGTGNFIEEDTPVQLPYRSTKTTAISDFCVRVSGDSMEHYCHDGDFLFVQKTNEELQNGEFGIFLYNGESVFKEYRNSDGYKALISLNPKYEDKIIDHQNICTTIGRVLGKYHID